MFKFQRSKELIAAGLDAKKTALIHIASDPDFFYTHQRKTGAVGFCSAFSERKNPEMVYQLIKNMPERTFYLIGRYWENYERYDEMKNIGSYVFPLCFHGSQVCWFALFSR